MSGDTIQISHQIRSDDRNRLKKKGFKVAGDSITLPKSNWTYDIQKKSNKPNERYYRWYKINIYNGKKKLFVTIEHADDGDIGCSPMYRFA